MTGLLNLESGLQVLHRSPLFYLKFICCLQFCCIHYSWVNPLQLVGFPRLLFFKVAAIFVRAYLVKVPSFINKVACSLQTCACSVCVQDVSFFSRTPCRLPSRTRFSILMLMYTNIIFSSRKSKSIFFACICTALFFTDTKTPREISWASRTLNAHTSISEIDCWLVNEETGSLCAREREILLKRMYW